MATAAPSKDDIAIIGMACRLPGARNTNEYWANLVGGVESIRQLTEEELHKAGVPRRTIADPSYVRACPVLDDIDKFDAAFFGISPRDASVMDPAHRFFLEVAWQALENSGNTGLADESVVGVFAASGAPLYWMNNVRNHRELVESMGEFLVRHTGNDMSFLATRVSYDLDLRGPSLNIQTACSSALVAAHLARQSLLARECDMALIGGSTILVPMGQGYHYKEGEILSPDGHCRPFDHRSAGTVFGSGTGCLVLKRLSDALDNGDTIAAVIKGSAINNDGSVKVGFLAPGVDGQAAVIKRALATAGVSARAISYVEAHGTGTSVGDPIELTALQQAFSEQTSDKQFCAIGSVKSNIGHLGEAAGAASLIKVVLALQNRILPPTLGFEKPNPMFEMDDSAFYVNAQPVPWSSDVQLRAGITALGAGGTNCHLVLEQGPAALAGEGGRNRHLLVLSAKSRSALDRMSENLADHLERHPADDLGDVAYTLALGRRSLSHRRVLVAQDHAEAIRLLRTRPPTRVADAVADPNEPSVIYMFPGGGAQYARMCLDLYNNEPAFAAALDACFAVIDGDLDPHVRGMLFASEADAEAATKQLQRPAYSLPTLFAVEYALAQLFNSYGLRPAGYIGHSMGQYVAACLAGVFSIRDGLRLVHLRGQLFETTQKGKMVGVSLSEQATRDLMPAGLSIAAVNAPLLCVASGPSHLIDEFATVLTAKEVDWTPIHIDVAAHSSLLEPILEKFRSFCRTIDFRAPNKPIACNLTGRWLAAAVATDPEYWVQHLRNTVRFSDCVQTALADANRVFLEIGPGRTLATLVGAQNMPGVGLNSVRHPKEAAHDVDYALLSLGKMWAAGAHVDWTALYDEQLRNRIALPSYPFSGPSYWVEPAAAAASTDLVKRENLDEWFYAVNWRPTPLPLVTEPMSSVWLLFATDAKCGKALADAIAQAIEGPCEIITVSPGAELRRLDNLRYELCAGAIEQYQQLITQLKNENRSPQHIVMMPGASSILPTRDIDQHLQQFFFAPVHLAQALAGLLDTVALTIISTNAFSLAGEALDPWARLSMGPALVIERELPEITTRLIDVRASDLTSPSLTVCMQQLARDLTSGCHASPVALRPPGRFTQHILPTPMPAAAGSAKLWQDGDVVLITGGLGGIGLAIAEHLARQRRLKFALLSREPLPGPSRWSALLADDHTPIALKRRIRGVQALQALDAQVFVVQGDVAVRESLAIALADVRARLGPLTAVIHAAGTIDDEPLQTKSDDKMRRVLAAKVAGTINLDALIVDDLKAFVLMSSVASFLGLPGQVDYTSANAFLDAFAVERRARKPGLCVSINWNAWRDVGMITDADLRQALGPLPQGQCNHPWLDASEDTPQGRRYFTDFQVATHWLLSEHQINGADALIPGTGFVELARAAFVDAFAHRFPHAKPATAVELAHVTFLTPFQVADTRRLQIDVEWSDGVANVQLRTASSYETHMTAEVRSLAAAEPNLVVDAPASRCSKSAPTRNGFLDQDFVRFGPRWQNLESICLGQGEAVIRLALNPLFADDLSVFVFHPALLDMATGAAQALIPGFRQDTDFFVPFGYDRISILGKLPRQITSHVRLRARTSAEVATFDVRIFDDDGVELVVVEGFTMRRVDATSAITQKLSAARVAQEPNAAMAALLAEAITKAEGVAALDRALAQTEMSQVVVSSVDVNVWLARLAADAKRLTGNNQPDAGPSFSRPDLSTDYVLPSTPLEVELAAIWSRFLGVGNVGVVDDFFALGGNSLIAVRFFARLKKDFGISLPLSTLFAAPTIRLLADVLHSHGYVERSDVALPTSANAQSSQQGLKTHNVPVLKASSFGVAPPILIRPGSGATPLFFVHDGLGEVLLYRGLAMRLAPEYNVYGLDPETSGAQFTHTRIFDMARAKVDRIRQVQPKGPYLLAGLCAGGIIAFEIARQLQDVGEQTLFVGIIDAADVHAEERKLRNTKNRLNRALGALRRPDDLSLMAHVSGSASALLRKGFNLVNYEVSSLLEREKNKKRVDQLQRQADLATSETSLIEFLKLYELAHKQHSPQGIFRGGDVVLFRATAGNGELADVPFREVYVDPLLGWQARVENEVTVVDVPGGHSSALQEPHVDHLARELQQHLDRAMRKVADVSKR